MAKIKRKNTVAPKGHPQPMGSPKKRAEKEEKTKAPDLSVLTSWLSFAKEASRTKHWEYFVIDQMLRGNHNVHGDPSDNTIVVTRRTESVNYPINKIFSTFRAVRAFVTRHHPVVDVELTEYSDEAKTYARRAKATLRRDNQLNNYRRLNKEWAYYGVKYGIGWRQIGYDLEKKCCIRWTIDPFDLLIGAKSGNPLDAPYMIKSIVRTMGYWKNKYPKAEVSPDNMVAADEYKRLALQIQFQDTQAATQNTDEQTAIGYECWYRVFEKNSAGGLINKVLFTDKEILDFVETPYSEYPFIPYYSEVVPNEINGADGHIKHIIPPQRMLNLLNTQMLEYNHIVNRGRFLKDKNSGFKVIYAKEGQVIEKKPGSRVEVLNPPSVNPLLRDQLTMSLDFIEDIGGQHDASLGAIPGGGVTSGKAIESLQLGDSNNISDLRDNFEDALASEATWILKMYSLFETEGVVINDQIKDNEVDKFAIMGEEALRYNNTTAPEKYYIEDDGSYCSVCQILPEHQVKVSVVSELGETRQARMELLLDLNERGVLPTQTLLKMIEFPNTDDVIQRIAEEATADIVLESMKANATQAPQGIPTGGGMPGAPMPPAEGAPLPPMGDGLGEQIAGLNEQLGGMLGGQ
jgi:hypothetical protein